MIKKMDALFSEAQKAFDKSATSQALYEAKVQYLGKQGSFSLILKEMGKLSPDEKRTVGKRANEIRDDLERLYAEHESELKKAELSVRLESERIDVTLPSLKKVPGAQHLIWQVTEEVCGIFERLGFSVRQGPHIEKDFYNFDALNIPADHASRDMQDTFYVEDGIERNPGEYRPGSCALTPAPCKFAP